ncbi:7644_t:CDS:1, partial [Gigaspora rosea]
MSVPALFSIEHIFASENECISFLFDKGILYEPTRLEKIRFERPSWRLDDPNSIRRVFD